VDGSESLRLFCALRLPGETVERLVRWQSGALQPVEAMQHSRIVVPENLHVTLAFLGRRPAAEVPAIARALTQAMDGAGELRLRVHGYRETRSVGMLTLDDEGGRAGEVAARLHAALEELGVYRREARPWLPHVTVLRFAERPRLRPVLPDLGEISPSDAAVYSSVLRRDGARYEVLKF